MKALYKCALFLASYFTFQKFRLASLFAFLFVLSLCGKSLFCHVDFLYVIHNERMFRKTVCAMFFSFIIWDSLLSFCLCFVNEERERERKRARNSDLVAFLVDVYSLTFFLCSFCWLLNSFLIFNALKLVEGILFIIADVIPSNGSSTIPHILLRYILSVICMHNICLA